jgi:hypothetical protein
MMRLRLLAVGTMVLGLLALPGGAWGKKCNDDAAVAAARAAADAECGCATAENHGQYVSCVADVADDRVGDGLLPQECKGAVTSCAARSTCGKPDAVTCCRIDRKGKVKCSIKRSAAKCKAPKDGSACVGTTASCCDACAAGCGATTTTTQAPTTTTGAPTTTTPAPTTTTTTLGGSPNSAFVDPSR